MTDFKLSDTYFRLGMILGCLLLLLAPKKYNVSVLSLKKEGFGLCIAYTGRLMVL